MLVWEVCSSKVLPDRRSRLVSDVPCRVFLHGYFLTFVNRTNGRNFLSCDCPSHLNVYAFLEISSYDTIFFIFYT